MTGETHDLASHRGATDWLWYLGVAGVVLYLLYGQLIPISEWVTALFPVVRDSHTGKAIAFSVYDAPKVLLLTGIVFATGALRNWFSPEKTRAILAGKREMPGERLRLVDRLKIGAEHVREIVGKVWIWVLVGIGIGAVIHGYAPDEMMQRIMGGEAWWSVPAAAVVGMPMYTNAAGVIPIVEALLGKGAALGTTLAFMMSVIALSLPEMVILKRVPTYRLIAIFIAVVSTGILATGFLFNFLL